MFTITELYLCFVQTPHSTIEGGHTGLELSEHFCNTSGRLSFWSFRGLIVKRAGARKLFGECCHPTWPAHSPNRRSFEPNLAAAKWLLAIPLVQRKQLDVNRRFFPLPAYHFPRFASHHGCDSWQSDMLTILSSSIEWIELLPNFGEGWRGGLNRWGSWGFSSLPSTLHFKLVMQIIWILRKKPLHSSTLFTASKWRENKNNTCWTTFWDLRGFISNF